jgi:sec-independent protein translocase protein TatC
MPEKIRKKSANKKTPPKKTGLPEAMPLLDHLIELRARLLWTLGAFIIAFIVSYVYAKDIYAFLVEPLAHALKDHDGIGARRLIYTNLTEAFFAYMGVALWTAFLITSPFMLAQVWMFLSPAFYTKEKKLFIPYFILTPFLFVAGAALAYYAVFPAAWGFFVSFETPHAVSGLPIQLEARVGDYLNLAMALIMAFGFAFELPLGLVLMVHVGIITAAQLAAFRRYAIVLIFVVAAIITPPDVISQISLAVPLCVLYELAVLAARMLEKTRKMAEKEA